MGFCLNYLVFISLSGVFFYAILGALAFINFEPLFIKKDNHRNTAYAIWATAGVLVFT